VRDEPRLPRLLMAGCPADAPPERMRQVALVNATLLASLACALLFGGLAWSRGDSFPALLNLVFACVLALLAVDHRLHGDLRRTVTAAIAAGGLFFWILIIHGSVQQSGFVWMVLYPVVSLFALGLRRGLVATGIGLAGAVVIFALSHQVDVIPTYPLLLVLRFVSVYLLVACLTYIMESTREHFTARLEEAGAQQRRQAAELEAHNAERAALIAQLEGNLREVRALRGLLPLCPGCRKVRDDDGYWSDLGQHLRAAAGTELTHGVCPDCARALYAEFMPEKSPET
jgi:hypothetical protein